MKWPRALESTSSVPESTVARCDFRATTRRNAGVPVSRFTRPLTRCLTAWRSLWTLGACAALFFQCSLDVLAADLLPLKSWTVKTDDTTMIVGVNWDNKLCLYKLTCPGVEWNWFSSPSIFPLMSEVEVGGAVRGLNWIYQDATVDKRQGTTVTIRFTNSSPAMDLKSVWQARPGPGPIRHTVFIRNRTGGMLTLHEQESLSVRICGPLNGTRVTYISDDGGEPDKVGVYGFAVTNGLKRSLNISSEKRDWIPFVDVNANGEMGIYVGWEWSNGRLTINGGSSSGTVGMEAGNGDDFKTDIYPGEDFEVPAAFIGAYKGEVDCGANSLRKYLFNYSMPALIRTNTGYPKLEWNAFAATGKGLGSWHPTETKYYPFIDDIVPLGFEEVTIDIGWWSDQSTAGHITADPVDWPSGMAAAARYAHKDGIRFGLYDNEVESLTTPVGKQNRVAEITYLIKGLGADFYRSDGTAGGVITGSAGPGSRAHYPQDVLYWSTKAFYEVMDELYVEIPDFLWENCNGGGRIKDYGALKRASKIQAQDSYHPIDARQAFYDSSFALHPMQIGALVGSYSEWQASGSVFEFRSSAMGAAYWHPDAPNGGNGGAVWSAEQRANIRKAATTYKEKLRPLIRNGDLYHIFPRPDDVNWDGIEYYDSTARKGVVYIFKPSGAIDSQVIKLRGLEAKYKYRISFEDGSNPNMTVTGAALMNQGIKVMIKGSPASELMFFGR